MALIDVLSRPPHYWQSACTHLAGIDSVMQRLVVRYRGSFLPKSRDAFVTLCRAIIGQQISIQAADSIWKRVKSNLVSVTPRALIDTKIAALSACGLSSQKLTCLRSLAEMFIELNINARYWKVHTQEEHRATLCAIKGIGIWTYEMFAIFYLRTPNILPINDIGLIKAIRNEYHYSVRPDKEEIYRLAALWKPWCTVATWYLWRSVDPDPIVY